MNEKLLLEETLKKEIQELEALLANRWEQNVQIRVNCLKSKYTRLFGDQYTASLGKSSNISEEEKTRLKNEFIDFEKYKESDEYKHNKLSWDGNQKEPVEQVYVKGYFRRSRKKQIRSYQDG